MSDLAPGSTIFNPTMFAPAQLVGGRIDPASTTNKEHQWAVSLTPGFYHVVVNAQTADGASGNLGVAVNRRPETGSEERLLSGNEIARQYRDQGFFEVKSSAVVPLKVVSNFGMVDYVMGVFANGTPVPSPAFDKCPTVMPLTVGTVSTFALGEDAPGSGDQWFRIDLPLGNYKVLVDATQTSGVSSNLAYDLALFDGFAQESHGKRVVSDNQIGVHFTAQGTLAIGESGSFWLRMRNHFHAIDVTILISAQ